MIRIRLGLENKEFTQAMSAGCAMGVLCVQEIVWEKLSWLFLVCSILKPNLQQHRALQPFSIVLQNHVYIHVQTILFITLTTAIVLDFDVSDMSRYL